MFMRGQVALSGCESPGLAAVSGGPDSVALFRIMTSLGVPFTVAHVNHKLRGDESDGDEAFVRELAESQNVPFRSRTLPISEGDSIEATARKLRYDWFDELALELNCGWVATAHSADDQVETVLHRIIRGTGLTGISGIHGVRNLGPNVNLIRPLLFNRRSELLEYLTKMDQPYRDDSSNRDSRFTRNKIRNEVLPMLRTVNPKVDEALLRLSQQASEYQGFISTEVIKLVDIVVLPSAGSDHILDGEQLQSLDPLLVREFFRRFWQEQSWPLGEMNDLHWNRLSFLESGDYPGGISVRRVGKVVQLRRKP